MDFTITNATVDDLPVIYTLFEAAIRFQKKNNYTGWDNYDKAFIQQDIENGFLFKLVHEDKIVCIFSICYSDPLIWLDKEKGNALYLHRVVTDRTFTKEKLFQRVLDWSIAQAQQKQLQYIRMDTWAANEKIIRYYQSYGFRFIENYTTPGTNDLPLQHRNLRVTLLEYTINNLPFNKTIKTIHMEKVNIINELATIDKYWTQKIIGEANGQLIKLAKGTGEINWHKHDDQDELFILYKGHLTIQLREKNIELYQDELYIVPKGVEHCPIAHGEAEFLIMGLNITSNAAGGKPVHFE